MNKRVFSIVSGPLLFALVLLIPAPESIGAQGWKVLAVALWMITWWVLETLASSVTALLPIILFPVLGVFSVQEVCAPYGSSPIFLFMGGFMIAMAMEKWNLHKRIALNMIRLTGTDARGIILGFMLATALLSMWISNTATAVMMLAIVQPTVKLLFEQSAESEKEKNKFALCLMLGIGYAASIGGIATIIGTPPNVVMVGILQKMTGQEVSFFNWMLACTPLMLLLLLFCYLMLTRWLFPFKIKRFSHSNELIMGELKSLGQMNGPERMVAVIFTLTALLWIFNQPLKNIPGLQFLDDTSIAMMGGLLLFIIPVKGKSLLQWEDTKNLHWGILLLFGGGLAMAKGLEKTGVINLLATIANSFKGINVYLLIIVLTTVSLFLTEIMSNVALATIMVPVVIGIANGVGANPVLFALPVTIATSYGFMMPISTPPNAIVYSTGYIRMKDMVKAGFWLDLTGLVLVSLFTVTLFEWVF
ncbi:MAG: DASS family sodium-coupled anion symporter [Bacteroidia bacterium]|nr:DASS family sodium-coupled anion symporter [Bacteroidia bacterium]